MKADFVLVKKRWMRMGVNITVNQYLKYLPYILFFSLTLYISARFNIWEDESYSLASTSRGVLFAWRQALYFEAQPPLYFIVLALWRFFSDSIFWARMLSVLFILLSVPHINSVFDSLHINQYRAELFLLFLMNPFVIWAATEIRLYAMVIFCSVVLVRFFIQIYYSDMLQNKQRAFFVVLSIACLATQYYLGFILFAFGISLFLSKRYRTGFYYLLDMIIPLILVGIMIEGIREHMLVHEELFVPETGSLTSDALAFIIQRIQDFLFPLSLKLSSVFYWIVRVVIVGGILLSLKHSLVYVLKMTDKWSLLVVVIVMTIFGFFIFILSAFGKEYTTLKYTSLLYFPVYLIYILFIIRHVKASHIRIWIAVPLAFSVISIFQIVERDYKVQDFKRVGAYLSKHVGESEQILIYRNTMEALIAPYYKGDGLLKPIPEPFDYQAAFSSEQWRVKPGHDCLKQIVLFDSVRYCWILLEENNMMGIVEGKEKIMEYMNQRFEVENRTRFGGGLVVIKYKKQQHD